MSQLVNTAPTLTELPRLKYKEYTPHIEVSFWYELCKRKLHEWRLQEPIVPLTLFNSIHNYNSAATANTVSVRRESLGNDNATVAAGLRASLDNNNNNNSGEEVWSITTLLNGKLQNFNTIEQLKGLPRREMMWCVMRELILTPLILANNGDNDESTSEKLEKSCEEINFALAAIFTYADLKNYRFYYAMAFPVLDLGSPVYIKSRIKGGYAATLSNNGINYFPNNIVVDSIHAHLKERLRKYPDRGPNPFIVIFNNDKKEKENKINFFSFTPSIIKQIKETEKFIIVMADTSTMEESPGWPTRNVIGILRLLNPSIKSFILYCIRYNYVEQSILFDCICDPINYTLKDVMLSDSVPEKRENNNSMIKILGWNERKGNVSNIYSIDLSAVMSPERLAESSARLNLSLMKWRMLPDLHLDKLSNCKALILGSGTLGCNVARHLLMWGVTKITLVDRGNVSYSNPVRQTLFELSDVINSCEEERNKAIAAAKALKRILPTVESKGICLNIHMPGHRIDKIYEDKAISEIETLDALIQSHDVIFLLTDSREARWLPTVIASAYNKPTINAALGFDTYLVMRHGINSTTEKENNNNNNSLKLGCYFCSDVVAPRDSMTARTLDQQCTVTRPGVSAIAAATALELLAQLYNHPLGFACPPYTENNLEQQHEEEKKKKKEEKVSNDVNDSININNNNNNETSKSAEGILGVIPHQIRGSVFGHCIYTLYGYQYELCTACSNPIITAYKKEGALFVLKCINDPLYIEEISGVKAFKEKINLEDFSDWDVDSSSD